MTDRIELLLEADRRGILPPEEKALLDEARRRGLVDQRDNFAETLRTAPTQPKGTIYGPSFGKASQIESQPGYMRTLLAGAIGSDQDLARNIQQTVPGSALEESETGRPLVRLGNGDAYEVNPEGLDPSDVMRFASKAASFLPAARGAAAMPNIAARAGVGAGLSAATEAGSQLAVGREQIDPAEVAFAGAGGAAGEVIGPLSSAIFGGATRRLPRAEAVRRARVVLADRAEGLPEDAAVQIGQRLDEIELGGSPDDLIGEAEFGFQYTKGQRTNDMRTLMQEERLSQTPAMLDVQRRNVDTANSAVRGLARKVAGGEVDTAPGAVSRATEAVQGEHKALKGQVDAAYARFRDTSAQVGPDAAQQLPKRLTDALADTNIDPINTPGAARAVEVVNKAFGKSAFEGEGALSALDAKRIDQVRRQLRTIGGSNPSDKRAVNLVIREMDGWLDDAVEQGLVSGDPKAIEFLKEARKLNTDLAKRFGESGMGKDVDRIVGKMLGRNATADELARTIYGATQVSSPVATRALQRIKVAMASKPEVWNQLRAQVLRSAVTGKGDANLGVQAIHGNLKELLINRPELMKSLFNPGELQTVQRMVAAMEPLLRQIDKRSSGSAERMMRMMAPYVTKFPVIRQLFDYGQQASETAAVRRSLAPLAPPRGNAVPAATMAGFGLVAPYLNPQGSSSGQ